MKRSSVQTRYRPLFRLRLAIIASAKLSAWASSGHDPDDQREDAALGLLAAGAAVVLVLGALLQQRRQALGAAVDLDEPVIFVVAAGGDGKQVGLEAFDAAGDIQVAPPTGRFGGDRQQFEPAGPGQRNQRQVDVGDR